MKNIEKWICMLLTLSFLVTGFCDIKPMPVNAEDDAVDMSMMLEKHDLETGEVSLVSLDAETAMRDGEVATCSFSYIPEGLCTEDMVRKVIGKDNRTQVEITSLSPYSAIAHLEIIFEGESQTGHGTGFLISKNVMLTAAHNCISEDGKSVSNMVINFGQNGNDIVRTATVKAYYVCANFHPSREKKDDYAIIVLNENVGYTTSWFSIAYYDDSFFDDTTQKYTVTGYPKDKVDKEENTMWTAEDIISKHETYILKHKVDTYGGQSGAPLYYKVNNKYTVVGIHIAQGGLFESVNYSRRITKELFDWLMEQGFIS